MPQIIVGAILIFVASYLVIALLTAAIFAAVVAALISAALYVGAISAFAISSAVANNRKHTYRFDISSDIPTILRVH